MTQPPATPYGDADANTDNDAADALSRLVAGNNNLVTHPHLVAALYGANATPQQASAIDQFVGGMQAQGAIQAARISGTKLALTSSDKSVLDSLGTDYSDVEYTQADQQADIDATQAQAKQIALASAQQKAASGGQDWSLGGLWHSTVSGLKTAGSDTLTALNKGWNVVDSRLSSVGSAALKPVEDIAHGNLDDLAPDLGTGVEQLASMGGKAQIDQSLSNLSQGNFAGAAKSTIAAVDSDTAQVMRDQGYDPSNPMSILAFQASGKGIMDAKDLRAKNPDIFDDAVSYANNPNAFVSSIYGDASLTPDQIAQKAAALNKPAFQNLVRQIDARRPTVGNVATSWIDPVKHPEVQQITSAVLDVAASFVADPTNALFAASKAMKFAAIGLNGTGLADMQKIRDVYDGTQKGVNAARARNGLETFVTNTNAVRDAVASGDDAAAAAAYARIHATTPGLEHLTDDFVSGRRAVDTTGKTFEVGKPITEMNGEDGAIEYLASKAGAVRLMAGRPTQEGRLMPGQLSAFGYRSLKGSVAATAATRSLKSTDRLINLNKPGVAGRILPIAEADQVDAATGNVIAGRNPTTVAPEDSAENLASRARGQAQFESRTSTMTPSTIANRIIGLVDPTAVAARARLAAARFTSYLPRDVSFATDDPRSVEEVRKYAKMYLGTGDSNLIAAKYAAGTEGDRKAILIGMHLQTLHAAGLAATEGGQQIIADAARSLSDESYSAVRGLDHRVNPDTGEDQASAIYDTQVNPKIRLTSFSTLQKNAAKIGIFENTVGRMFNNTLVDNLMPLVKKGWTSTFTNVYRNAVVDELAMAATRGDFGDVMRAKAIATDKGLLPARTKLGNALAAPGQRVGQMYRKMAINTASKALGLKYIADLDPDYTAWLADNWMRMHADSMVDPVGAGDVGDITKAGYIPTELHVRTGYGDIDVGGDMRGAERLAQALAIRINGNPEHAQALMDHLQAVDNPAVKEVPGVMRDTRGKGVQYHGARAPIDSLSEGYANSANIYGSYDTFYTTDAADIAAGYGRKSPNAHVYKVTENKPIKTFDMEGKTSPADIEELLGVTHPVGDLDDFAKDAISRVTDSDGLVSLRDAMDEIRRDSKAEGYSRDDVQELFDTATENLQQKGYRAMRHTGGQLTGRPSHEVKIYLRPHEDVDIAPHTVEREPSHTIAADAPDLGSVVNSLKAPQNAKRVDQMTMANSFVDADGVARKVSTPEEKQLALTQLAEIQTKDMRWMLQDHSGNLNTHLIEQIRKSGKAPTPQWIMDNMTGEQRPVTVNAPIYEARPAVPGITGMLGALNDVTGKGYKWMVERPITRMSTMPIFLSNYGKSRYFLRDAEQAMIDGGLSPEAADETAKSMAMDRAFHQTTNQIDDPTLRSQMDLVGRNFFAFSRATTAFVRRWGNSFVEDPGRLRKVTLAMEGGQKSGLIWTDQNGQMQFSYPGSGLAIDAMMKVADLIPGVNLIRVPGAISNLTGKVALLQPGVQNPLQFGLTPLVNMPYRAVEQLFPQEREAMDGVDQFFNGTNGAGQPWYSEIEPTTLKKFSDALSSDDRDSMMADSVRGSILNLTAGGHVPPADADPATVDTFLSNLQTQTKNTLVARAIFGFFAPSPPGTPELQTAGSQQDWYFTALGVRGLDAEYKEILNESGGDPGRASQIWAAIHPDKLFYTTPTTTNATKSATYAATTAAQNWLTQNLSFMQRYKGVSAYFIPADTQRGNFDLGAYNAELELGLRQHKSTAEFYTDVRTANAANQYYAQTALRDAAIVANPDNKTAINAAFSDWEKGFNATNPLWAQQQQDYSNQATTALGQLSTLRNMLTAKNLPASVPAEDLRAMVQEYDQYHEAINSVPGSTNVASAMHAQMSAIYDDRMTALVNNNPALAGIYQGVFRSLDGKVLDKLGSS